MTPTPDQIKAARAKAGLTQTEAAERIGMTRAAWARYEAGKRPLTPSLWDLFLHRAGLERMPFKRNKLQT